MGQNNNNLDPAVAVILVCLNAKTTEEIAAVLQRMPWQPAEARFDAYISAERRPSLPPQMNAASLRIAFVDFDADPEAAAESTRHLKQIFQNNITVVAVAEHLDPEFLLSAMRAGCSEFLQQPVAPLALSKMMMGFSEGTAAKATQRTPGTILSFFGAKGGVGTTTVAVHFATYLVQCCGKRTLLIDNHSELGHVCVYLGLDGSHFTFQEVLQNVSRLDSELLKGYVARHSSGLEVLSSPELNESNGSINPASMMQTLDFLRGEYDFVIVDSSMSMSDENLAIMESSSEFYMVAAPDVASLRDCARYLESIKQPGDYDAKLKVVINRHSSSTPISIDQIEAAISHPVAFKLPNSVSELEQTTNLGQVLPPKGKSDFGKQMVRWVSSVAGPVVKQAEAPAAKKAPLFRWMQPNQIAN
jgi:pilus assembly protein CpaE